MGKTFLYMISIIINIIMYFILQVIASFVQVGIFGSGNFSAGKTVGVSFCFFFFQLLILFILYNKKLLLKELLILNILICVGLFLYFVIYLPFT